MKGELCLKSGYNFLESTLKIDDIILIAKERKYDFVALVDKNVMYGAMEFYQKCLQANIKPLLGLEFSHNGKTICLLAKDKIGYFNLSKLSSFLNNKQNKNQINFIDLKQYSEGLICILPSYRFFKEVEKEEIDSLINYFKTIYAHFYIGMESYEIEKNYRLNAYLREKEVKRVPFNNINCKDNKDRENIELLKNIQDNKILGFTRNNINLEYTYFIDEDKKRNLFLYEEIAQVDEIVNLCNLSFSKESLKIVNYKNELKIPNSEYLKRLSYKGLEKRNSDFIKNKDYLTRLDYELGVISKMGFESYFLVVYDYVKFAKKNGIMVGPGRGSAAGSLVSYVLGITNVNPLEHHLLFERFLNVERISMPDIDIDFQDNRRDEVVNYLKERYGNKRVANIVTFSTLAAKQVLRDVAKTIGLGKEDLEAISRVAHKSGALELEKMYALSKEFKTLIDSEYKYQEVFRLAKSLEGLPRQTSLHAAGVVISNDDLENILPVVIDEFNNYIVQYDMNYLENLGLLKMDILGLKNLTIIDDCLKEIKSVFNVEIDINRIDLNDPLIYKLIASGKTSGLFQLESEGMKKTIKQVSPKSFDDLSSILALYRPGPRDFIEEFCLRKEGKMKIVYPDDSLKPILDYTYGILVYQEQILQVVQVFASFSLAKADLLRRAISKKDLDNMKKLEADFIQGSLKNGHSESKAKEVYELIMKFASYGFNKSHSVSYAIISAQMTYLKLYYPSIFFACVMNSFVGGSDVKFLEYVSECKENKISLLLPSVNHSQMIFKSVGKDKIYYSLGHIKGINSMFVLNVIGEAKIKPFDSYQDFIIRMAKYKLSKAQIITLIDAGALDEFKYNRATMKHNFDKLEKYLNLIGEKNDNQMVFDISVVPPPNLEIIEESGDKLALEKDLLGIFISGFPLEPMRDKLKSEGYSLISEFEGKNEKIFKCVLLIKNIKIIKTKKNQLMSIVSCLDESGEVSVVVFPSLHEKVSSFLVKGNYLDVVGKVKIEENLSLVAESIRQVNIKEDK